jgi:hypothetical protein
MIEGALLVWFEEQRAMNLYLNGTIIKEKAEVICLRLSIHFMLQTAGIINSRIIVCRIAGGALRSVGYIFYSSNK